MANILEDEVKKIFLLGIGAAATTAEKSKALVDDLVKKGEITVEEGKTLNQELKHKMNEKKAEAASKAEKAEEPADKKEADKTVTDAEVTDFLSKLSPEQLAALKEQVNKAD
ncbi:MAG: hypothetical protein LKG48_08190 [Lachnospiraceae bacterium]|jgi:polyhydroxyalkanoate synthesis regulator phasin|nr:hypothetical protein [Lachnospiraceae bacterium]MCH4064655.1 hypothetical protein [Lachnospiraceae bacterium]MCH4104887.1 hypothetical protein [Lachnospiraceae bacterium]MCI1309729.1 hypothetical protein [Lachnospiraceae bacterium]MCI1334116.1 hypothetical protein [Lachnospiraceae bacterium]